MAGMASDETRVDLLEEKRMEDDDLPSKNEKQSDETNQVVDDGCEEVEVSKKRLLLSLVVVCGVAIAWVSSTQFSKYALQIDSAHFNAPYFMLWLNTSWMLWCLPIFLLYSALRGTGPKEAIKAALPILGSTPLRAFLRVFLFLFLWSGANYCYLKSLSHVSASVATSISSCNAAIVYVLALFLLGDRFMLPKLVAVFLAIAGVVLISMDGKISAEWRGVLMAIVSACFTGTYKVLFKRIVGDATLGQVSLFMSALGALNVVINGAIAFTLVGTGIELLDWSYVPWLPLCGSGSLNLLFNFLINFGIALLHPLVISVGMLVGLPLNTVVDIVFSNVALSAFFISGSLLIILSFILVIFPYSLVPACRRAGLA